MSVANSNGESRSDASLALRGIVVERDGVRILDGIDWSVFPGERWAVLGRNGSGKTTLIRVVSMYLHPTKGTVDVLGEQWGETDVRTLRTRIGLASQSFSDMLRVDITAADAVMSAKNAALEPWWHTYDDSDRSRAREMLGRLGLGDHVDRNFGTLSSGERQRVQLARTLMTDPALLLLDEPTAALDLGGREDLVATLSGLALDPATPPVVLVTHHVEEIPTGFTHVLLLAAGRVAAAGPIDEVLTAANLSECFGVQLTLERRHGRWLAFGENQVDLPQK